MRFYPLAAFALMAVTPATGQSIHDRIYQPPSAPLTTAGLPATATIDQVSTVDGLLLKGVEVPPKGDAPVLLIFHGNAGSAARSVDWFAPLVAKGYGIVAAEYRGYSANPGRPDEKGLAADADAFYARARALAGGRKVIVIGHSLGGGVAFGLSTRQTLDALVTIGTFTRLRAMAPRIARAFISDRYENAVAVRALDEPYYLIHGTADDTVPAQFGNELHNAAVKAGKPGASYVLTGQSHTPEATVLMPVIESIVARLRTPPAVGPALPDTVKVYPFR
ncbi:alpha/beta hydrolase [Sphingomonas sp. Leaf17]|uniref:alpha/beta hydrolase n=1 Tax=Sphingomonas sp. Leaf17 TaxID=1735683 RepID=UPI0006FA5BDF|nr:alpha/beta fold hydrolase [Sphingomonas sp. Leaf17]KQM63271.1 alpha/beta hydrolase [Sphingomonas sp. Leaf17]